MVRARTQVLCCWLQKDFPLWNGEYMPLARECSCVCCIRVASSPLSVPPFDWESINIDDDEMMITAIRCAMPLVRGANKCLPYAIAFQWMAFTLFFFFFYYLYYNAEEKLVARAAGRTNVSRSIWKITPRSMTVLFPSLFGIFPNA